MKKGIIIGGVSCLILLGTAGIITTEKMFIGNEKNTKIETSAYQSKEINRALATSDDVVGSWDVSEKQNGSVMATLYNGGKMIISGTGAMKEYVSPSDKPYYNKRESITSVEIQQGVTSIGTNIFRGCVNLESIIIPDSVTSIGDYAFRGCSSLISITIPASVTNIENGVFEFCIRLTSIKVEENNKNYMSDNGVLFNKDKTKIICYPAGKRDTLSYVIPNTVISIEDWTFGYCTSLTSIIIPDSVMNIGNDAFCYCTSLTSIIIPDSVTNIGEDAFAVCAGLTSITIPNSVTSIGFAAFSSCNSLTSIIISDSVTRIENDTFHNCSSLTSITIPDSVKSIGYSAFGDCTSLTSITIPNSVTRIEGYAFSGCNSLISITIPNSVTRIEYNAFSGCSSLTSIIIPDSVKSIGNYAFQSCDNLVIYCKNNTKAEEYAKENAIKYIIDDLPPVVSVTGNPTEWTRNNVTLTVSAKDDLSGLAEQPYSFDNGATWQKENTKTYTENTNGIVIKVKDKVGNIKTTDTINITKIIEPESITIKTKPNKITYYQGENLDTTGLELILEYNTGLREIITSGYTITPKVLNTLGTQEITLTYEGKTTTFNVNVLKVIDTDLYKLENNNIKGIQPKTTLEEFGKNTKINGTNTKIVDKNNKELKNTDLVTTGTKVITTVNNEEKSYILIVTGDTNGDGQSDLKDILAINKHRLNKAQLTNEYLLAGDVNNDGKVDIRDLLQINKFRLGKINKL